MPEKEQKHDYESQQDIERRLLQDPISNAGELYDIYHARIEELCAGFTILSTEEEKSEFSSLFFDLCNRQKTVSKLLPSEDPRSYESWKNEINQQTMSGQQG